MLAKIHKRTKKENQKERFSASITRKKFQNPLMEYFDEPGNSPDFCNFNSFREQATAATNLAIQKSSFRIIMENAKSMSPIIPEVQYEGIYIVSPQCFNCFPYSTYKRTSDESLRRGKIAKYCSCKSDQHKTSISATNSLNLSTISWPTYAYHIQQNHKTI